MIFKERLEEMKLRLAELKAEWDRLDHVGTETDAQRLIAFEMKKISETMVFWVDLLKEKEKK